MKMEMPGKAGTRAVKSKRATRWHGAIEGVHRGIVYGWAVDSERPGTRVVLEVCLNDEPIASLMADVSRTDLIAAFEQAAPGVDACHGFIADLRISSAEQGVLSVRVANTEHVLDGAFAWGSAEKPTASATSHVHCDGALRLHGWAIDPANEKRTVTVSAYVGSEKVAQASADQHAPALRGSSASGHAFTLDLPLSLADGKSHTIRVVDEHGIPVNGSPVTVCTYAAGLRALLPEAGSLVAATAEMYERFLPRSLGLQHYPAWQAAFDSGPVEASSLKVAMIVVPTGDKGSDDAAVAVTVDSLRRQRETSLQIFTAGTRAGFAAALAQARAASCDVIGCIRAGDTLPDHALAKTLTGFSLEGAQIVYSDSEFNGKPWFKPAWNPDYAFGTDYPLELMLVRSALVADEPSMASPRKRGAAMKTAAEPAVNPAAFAWNALAAAARHTHGVVHVPHVLYRFNTPLDSVELAERDAACGQAASVIDAAITITSHEVAKGAFHACRRVSRPLGKKERQTSVSLIIPTRDYADMLKRCIDSVRQHTDWPNLEIIVIDNGSIEASTKTYFRSLAKEGIRVLPMPGPFNFADLNNRAVEQASGDIVGLINNDIEALHDGWLDEIVGQLLRPEVGAVGAKLLWPNGMVQHGGVLMGVGNAAGHYGNLLADQDWGDHGRNQLVQQVSGVTAACLFMRRADYLAIGGMDGIAFPVAFNDVDLCLKIRAAGKAIVWTPHARLLHAESASRGHEDSPQKRARAQRELEGLRKRWAHVLLRDPAYHPSLNLDVQSQAFGGLAIPPRDRAPRTGQLLATAQTPTKNKSARAATEKKTAAKPKAARTKKSV